MRRIDAVAGGYWRLPGGNEKSSTSTPDRRSPSTWSRTNCPRHGAASSGVMFVTTRTRTAASVSALSGGDVPPMPVSTRSVRWERHSVEMHVGRDLARRDGAVVSDRHVPEWPVEPDLHGFLDRSRWAVARWECEDRGAGGAGIVDEPLEVDHAGDVLAEGGHLETGVRGNPTVQVCGLAGRADHPALDGQADVRALDRVIGDLGPVDRVGG